MAVLLRRDFRPSFPVVSKQFIDWSRAAFFRIQIGQGCSQLDLCVLNSYSPTICQGASSEAREAHELSRAAHWQKCERVLRIIPRRCELVWAMDRNARMATALPWVGAGGSRSKHREVWNCNGGDLFDILKEHHLKAANTFHAARARSWTWQQQRQDKQIRHRLDYFIVPMAAQWKCQVDYDSPVNLSGYRDHRPVGLLIPMRRRWKQEQTQQQMFHRWDHEHLQMTRRAGTSWLSGSDERAVQEKVAVAASVIRISREPAPVRLEMLEHALVSAAATVYELNNTKQTRATMQYSVNTLKMIKEKQTLLHEMRKASSSSTSSSCVKWQDRSQALIQQQKAISKPVRAVKRDRVEKLLMRAEEGKGAGVTRIINRTINSLAPKQQGARETVWDAEGRACFGEAEELDARAQALQSIMAAEEQNEEEALATEKTRTRRTQAISAHKFNEKQVYNLIMGLRDNKGGPKRLDLEMDAGKVRPPSCGSWWLDSAVDYRQCSGLTWPSTEERHRTTKTERWSSSRKQGKNLREARNGWRTINLLDHQGKACSRGLLQPHMPEITSKMHRFQFGALLCRGTREAILLVDEVLERFRSMTKHKKSSQRPLRKMAVLLFDLGKAFDCIPRDRAFSEPSEVVGSNGLKLSMEDLHKVHPLFASGET